MGDPISVADGGDRFHQNEATQHGDVLCSDMVDTAVDPRIMLPHERRLCGVKHLCCDQSVTVDLRHRLVGD